jgi:cytochrome c-type biogenesis protein CcmH
MSLACRIAEPVHQAEFQNHYLMIYVKAARGRPMPIAIQKIQLKDFTGVVILTDENSVMPTKKLSQSSKVLANGNRHRSATRSFNINH